MTENLLDTSVSLGSYFVSAYVFYVVLIQRKSNNFVEISPLSRTRFASCIQFYVEIRIYWNKIFIYWLVVYSLTSIYTEILKRMFNLNRRRVSLGIVVGAKYS